MKQWIWICWLLVSPLCLAQEMSEKNWQDIFDASCEMLKVEADREKGNKPWPSWRIMTRLPTTCVSTQPLR